MIGDGLSHVGFGSLAIATATGMAPLAVSIPITLVAAFLLLRLSENSKIKGDAAIALISSASVAIGVIIISLTTGMNTDVCNYLFGSILAMSKPDVTLSVILAAVVLVLFAFFYHKIFAITFDETHARAVGVKAGLYNMIIAFLTAITIVLGMRMMGALLISSLIIFPALTSMRVFTKFKTVSISAGLVSLVCFFVGVTISYLYATPTGASVVAVNIIAFLLFWAVGSGRAKVRRLAALGTSVLFLFLFVSCAAAPIDSGDTPTESSPQSDDSVYEIKEKMFIAQLNDVYLNTEEYLGKKIKYEGLFTLYHWEETNKTYCQVYRQSPGCCGADGQAGFEVYWPESDKVYPNENDWCEVIGTLETYQEDGMEYLQIALDSLTIKSERGLEFVTQ
jgi:zinc transport system permease protein